MIVDHKNLCKEVSEENNVDLNLLLSINNIVFTEVYDWTKNPDCLKIYLKHFGSWFFKNKKTNNKLIIYNRVIKGDPTITEENKLKILNKIKNYNFILSEYEKYTKDRYEVKCKKYGKEAYEAYCMAKKQEKIQKSKKNKSL